MPRSQSHILTSRDEIRRWAEERNGSPACVRGTGDGADIGVLRLDFPGYSGQQSLEHIGWDEWLDKFEERGLALLVQDATKSGERSNFNKIISRQTARAQTGTRSRRRTAGPTASRKRTSARGRTKTRSSKSRSASGTRRTSGARKSRSASAKSASRTRAKRQTTAAKTRRSASTRASSTRARRQRSSPQNAAAARRSSTRTAARGRSSSKSHALVDHGEIRRWAEKRNARPACVRGTGGSNDPGMIRLDFPGFSGARSLEHIDWDEWFRAFDANNLALLVQDTTARGQRSNFNKLVAREGTMRAGNKRTRGSRQRASKTSSAPKKGVRGSTHAHGTESARGRKTSERRAA